MYMKLIMKFCTYFQQRIFYIVDGGRWRPMEADGGIDGCGSDDVDVQNRNPFTTKIGLVRVGENK